MEQPQYLIDSNAIIDYLGEKLPVSGMAFMNNVIDVIPKVSVITKIEVLGFNAPAQHYQLLTDFMGDATVLGLTDSVVDFCIDIRKKYKTKLPDALIAATSLAHGLILITRNISDFKKIQGLQLLNPHDL